MHLKKLALVGLAAFLATGCMLKPSGTKQQEQQLAKAGAPYQKPFEQRTLPEIPAPASWQDALQRALLANGELEAAYHEWRAADERIGMASYWPNSNLQLGFEYMFTKESMKTWDRVTASASFDPSAPLKLPTKVAKGGEAALANAQQAAAQFSATKFRIQRQALSAYLDLAYMEEQIRLAEENSQLQKITVDNARSRLAAGGAQQDLLQAQIAVRMTDDELASMRSQAASMRAMLNAMMARPANAPLEISGMPEHRPVPSDDQLVAMGVDTSPEIARLAAQVKGRKDAIDLAKMQYLPDISPTAAITGDVSRSLGAMIMVPTTIPMIDASIREAKAMRDASEAMLRQTRQDKSANFVATLYAMRNAERQEQFYRERILPATRQVLSTARQDYIAGKIGLSDLVTAQRLLIGVDQSIARFHTDRDKRLAELEEISGMDVEVMNAATTQATTAPATVPVNQ